MLDRRLLFVTGKGGVGKTSVAAGLALLAAREGKRTLLCETDAKGDLAVAFETGPLAFEPTEVSPGLHAMVMDTEAALTEYLRINVRLPRLAPLGPLAASFDFVATAAPGVKEILSVGKLAWEVREDNYDLVVVDASASGHVVGQLAAPAAIHDLVKVGPVRDQTRWMLDILHDPDQTGAVVVALPEEMPITETMELAERLDVEASVDLAAVVVNRVLPQPFTRAEREVFSSIAEPGHAVTLAEIAGTAVRHVVAGTQLAVELQARGAEHITRLRSSLDGAVPVVLLPELFTKTDGIRSTTMIADALGDELL